MLLYTSNVPRQVTGRSGFTYDCTPDVKVEVIGADVEAFMSLGYFKQI